MNHSITPLAKLTLADNLALELKKFIMNNQYYPGAKLPSTSELAKNFGVGMPTLREAIKKLETIGAVIVKHGSGLFVGDQINSIILVNPISTRESPSKKHLLDLIDARMSVEISTAELAAENATGPDIEHMVQLLKEAEDHIADDIILSQKNMDFHMAIAAGSGNIILSQLVEATALLFKGEQQLIIGIFKNRYKDHQQHMEILEAIKAHDAAQTVRLMRAHLQDVRKAILKWDPQ